MSLVGHKRAMPRAAVEANTWRPTGLDYLKDGLWGKLGAQKNFGETHLSGALNGLAIHQDLQQNKIFFYVGSVNGGVFLRVYDKEKDVWADSWQPLSRPGSGYQGSQAISKLAISKDGRYLAVGQGAVSNWGHVAPPSRGVQMGAIQSDGTIRWLPTSEVAQQELSGLNIASLEWKDNSLVASSWNPGERDLIDKKKKGGNLLTIQAGSEGILSVKRQHTNDNNPVLDSHDSRILVATSNFDDKTNALLLDGAELSGSGYSSYLQSLKDEGVLIARVSLYTGYVDGRLIAFIGSYKPVNKLSGVISRIDRLEINPNNNTLETVKKYAPPKSAIGNNQASNNLFIGNFSLEADPADPRALSVLAGGNHFQDSAVQASVAPLGGLVRIDYGEEQPKIDAYIYGARTNKGDGEGGELVIPLNPGQPHADSRSIAFYDSATGPMLVEIDDGGIWDLKLDTTSQASLPSDGAWWTPLSGPGLAALEVNDVDWGHLANSVATAYQDNAASLGYYGDRYSTNIHGGDGQVAFFDDAGKKRSFTAYLGNQNWLSSSSYKDFPWTFVDYDREGFIKDRGDAHFYVQNSAGLVPWSETSEYLRPKGSGDTKYLKYNPFSVPHEENAYRRNAISFAGALNVYETVPEPEELKDPHALVFRELFKNDIGPGFLMPTALDNQGSKSDQRIDSLYAAAAVVGNPLEDKITGVKLYGRQATNKKNGYYLKPLRFTNLSPSQLLSDGVVVDLAHQPSDAGKDMIFWLQGGASIASKEIMLGEPRAEDQVLRVGRAGESVETFRLSDLGLPVVAEDYFGYQNITFVPKTANHSELLVVGGLHGVWASRLDADGKPQRFRPMSWSDVPSFSGPGSYVKTMKYNPDDDLLIAGTQGQGSFVYSFTGKVGSRPAPDSLLHVSDVQLYQSPDPKLDRRGSEANSLIPIALDSRLQSESEPTKVRVTLHDAPAWKDALEMVSLYNNGLDPGVKKDDNVVAVDYFNILDPKGLEFVNGVEDADGISFELVFEPGVSLFNLQVNAKDEDVENGKPPLRFSVSLEDGSEGVTRSVVFASAGFLGNGGQVKQDQGRSSLMVDPLIGGHPRRSSTLADLDADASLPPVHRKQTRATGLKKDRLHHFSADAQPLMVSVGVEAPMDGAFDWNRGALSSAIQSGEGLSGSFRSCLALQGGGCF